MFLGAQISTIKVSLFYIIELYLLLTASQYLLGLVLVGRTLHLGSAQYPKSSFPKLRSPLTNDIGVKPLPPFSYQGAYRGDA